LFIIILLVLTTVYNFCYSIRPLFTISVPVPATVYNFCVSIRPLFTIYVPVPAIVYNFCDSIRPFFAISVPLFTITLLVSGHCLQLLCSYTATVPNPTTTCNLCAGTHLPSETQSLLTVYVLASGQ
jgi:hypothetical protein